MKWSVRIGTFAGIGVFIHWTFLLLIGYVLYRELAAGSSPAQAAGQIVFILAIFACVVLHEFGHALTARRFGVRTRDIILLPIGGVARLERMPEKPIEEFLVAIAGPLVNVVIAGVLVAFLLATDGFTSIPAASDQISMYADQVGFLERLLFVNIMLVLFNMLPAFPMDGGRILRAALATQFDYAKATRIAAGVGQFMAALLATVAVIWGPWLLLVIAVFVYLGAQGESRAVQTRSLFDGLPVSEAMVTEFRALPPDATLGDAADALLAGSQQDFPVLDDGRVLGILPRADLFRALTSQGRDAPVAAVMRRDCAPIAEDEPLTRVFERMQQNGCPLLPVVRAGRLVGLVTMENIGELFMLRSAGTTGGRPRSPDARGLS